MEPSSEQSMESSHALQWVIGGVVVGSAVLVFWLQVGGFARMGGPVYQVTMADLPIPDDAVIAATAFYDKNDTVADEHRSLREVSYQTDERLTETVGEYAVWAYDQGLQSRDNPQNPGQMQLLQGDRVVMIIKVDERAIEGDGTSEAEQLGVDVRPAVETTVTVTVPATSSEER